METKEALRHVGGGTREDMSDAEKERYAAEIAQGANSYARYLESRPFDEIALQRTTATATVDGETVTVNVDPFDATSVPEGFGANVVDDAPDDEPETPETPETPKTAQRKGGK